MMTTSQTNSGANRTVDAETPPNQASDTSAESKKNKNKKNNNRVIHSGLMKDEVLKVKGVVILSGRSTHMTTDFRLFITALISYAASKAKGYKRWPGVLEKMEDTQ